MLVDGLLVGRLDDLPALDVEDAVLAEENAYGILAQRDVVVLRAREVLEQVPVALRWDDAKVEAEALVGDDGRLRAPRATTSATHSRSEKKAVREGGSAVAIRSRSFVVS